MSSCCRCPGILCKDKSNEMQNKIPNSQTGIQDKGWHAMIQYFRSNGTEGDTWGSRERDYRENNITLQTRPAKLLIMEPCNYASNLAYYRSAVVVCKYRSRFEMEDKSINAIGKSSVISFSKLNGIISPFLGLSRDPVQPCHGLLILPRQQD